MILTPIMYICKHQALQPGNQVPHNQVVLLATKLLLKPLNFYIDSHILYYIICYYYKHHLEAQVQYEV